MKFQGGRSVGSRKLVGHLNRGSCLTYDVKDCQGYKVAIYLQDHVNNLSGLKVKLRSHKIASTQLLLPNNTKEKLLTQDIVLVEEHFTDL